MSGRQLVAALAIIALLTFVLPPLVASRVNRGRIERARDEIQLIVDTAAHERGALPELEALSLGAGPVVFAGAGGTPKFAGPAAWPERRVTTAGFVSPDPWGNQYFVVMPARPGEAVVVLSAGPNGIVETLFETVAGGSGERRPPAGDDISGTRRFLTAR